MQAARRRRAHHRQAAPRGPRAARDRRQHAQRAVPVALLRRPLDADVGRRRRRGCSIRRCSTPCCVREARPGPDPPPYQVNVTLPPELTGQTRQPAAQRRGHRQGRGRGGGRRRSPRRSATALRSPASSRSCWIPTAPSPSASRSRSRRTPPPPPAATSMTQSCPPDGTTNTSDDLTVTGTLSGAPAGSTVEVTFKNPSPTRTPAASPLRHRAPSSCRRRPTPRAHGPASVDPNDDETGEWRVSSRFAGTSTHAPSSAGECAVQVHTP